MSRCLRDLPASIRSQPDNFSANGSSLLGRSGTLNFGSTVPARRYLRIVLRDRPVRRSISRIGPPHENASAGLIAHFTAIKNPYEASGHPELRLNASMRSLEDLADAAVRADRQAECRTWTSIGLVSSRPGNSHCAGRARRQ